MRLFFIALLIALLPLRNGIGDVIALGLQTQAVAVASAHCADHTQATGHTQSLEAADTAHGQACSDCQMCHGVALPTTAPTLPLGHVDHPAPSRLGSAFASAAPALGFKPPIS